MRHRRPQKRTASTVRPHNLLSFTHSSQWEPAVRTAIAPPALFVAKMRLPQAQSARICAHHAALRAARLQDLLHACKTPPSVLTLVHPLTARRARTLPTAGDAGTSSCARGTCTCRAGPTLAASGVRIMRRWRRGGARRRSGRRGAGPSSSDRRSERRARRLSDACASRRSLATSRSQTPVLGGPRDVRGLLLLC